MQERKINLMNNEQNTKNKTGNNQKNQSSAENCKKGENKDNCKKNHN